MLSPWFPGRQFCSYSAKWFPPNTWKGARVKTGLLFHSVAIVSQTPRSFCSMWSLLKCAPTSTVATSGDWGDKRCLLNVARNCKTNKVVLTCEDVEAPLSKHAESPSFDAVHLKPFQHMVWLCFTKWTYSIIQTHMKAKAPQCAVVHFFSSFFWSSIEKGAARCAVCSINE